MAISIEAVTGFGKIDEGDLLVIEKQDGSKIMALARKVLNKGCEKEETIISLFQSF